MGVSGLARWSVDADVSAEVISAVLGVMDHLGVNTTLYGTPQGPATPRHSACLLLTSARTVRNRDLATSLFDLTTHDAQAWHDAPLALEHDNFDAAILTSCDIKFWGGSEGRAEGVLAALGRSSAHVVCIPHEVESYGLREGEDDFGTMAEFGLQGRLEFYDVGSAFGADSDAHAEGAVADERVSVLGECARGGVCAGE